MSYEVLIEANDNTRKEVFAKQVKPYLNKGEAYYKVYLLDEQCEVIQCLVGYAFRCSYEKLCDDLNKWALEEIDGFGDFAILRKEFGTDKVLERYIF